MRAAGNPPAAPLGAVARMPMLGAPSPRPALMPFTSPLALALSPPAAMRPAAIATLNAPQAAPADAIALNMAAGQRAAVAMGTQDLFFAAGTRGVLRGADDTTLSEYLLTTRTPTGEVELLKEAIDGTLRGRHWLAMVRMGLQGDERYSELSSRPLVDQLRSMARGVIVPNSNLGVGALFLRDAARFTSTGTIAADGSVRFFYNPFVLDVSIGVLQYLFSGELYGRDDTLPGTTREPEVRFVQTDGWSPYERHLFVILRDIDRLPHSAKWRRALGVSRLHQILYYDYSELHRALLRLEALIEVDDLQVRSNRQGDEQERLLGELKRLHDEMLNLNYPINQYEHPVDLVIFSAEPGAGVWTGPSPTDLSFTYAWPGSVIRVPAGHLFQIGAGVMVMEVPRHGPAQADHDPPADRLVLGTGDVFVGRTGGAMQAFTVAHGAVLVSSETEGSTTVRVEGDLSFIIPAAAGVFTITGLDAESTVIAARILPDR